MVEDFEIKATTSPFAVRANEIKVFDGKDGYVSINQIVNKINMNDLDENDIVKIIMKKNNDLKSSEIQDLVAKSSYKKMGASKLEKLLECTH